MSISESSFLSSLPDLKGKVAIVTGGAAGIGLQTTIYLARKGCTVYVASRNREKSLRGIAAAKAWLVGGEAAGPIHFHHLDLATIESSWESAGELLKLLDRLDILIANAGAWRDGFSKDGYENTFQTNHLGHFVFVMRLLDLLEKTAKVQGDARIVVTTSQGYMAAAKPDYGALKKSNAAPGLFDGLFSFRKYMNSKLHNVYFATELDTKLRERGVTNVISWLQRTHDRATETCIMHSLEAGTCTFYAQAIICTAGATDFGSDALSGNFAFRAIRDTIKLLARTFGNTVEDSAKTQIWLAASEKARENDVHGQYWEPIWSWSNYYRGSRQVEMTRLARDEEERKRSWDFAMNAMREAGLRLEGWV